MGFALAASFEFPPAWRDTLIQGYFLNPSGVCALACTDPFSVGGRL